MPTKKKSTIENTDAIEEKKNEVKKEAVAEKAAVKPAAKKAAAQPRAKKQAKPDAPAADAVSEPKAETKKEEVVPVTDIRVVPKKKILFVASESTPFIATGGLAEVIGSLSKALAQNADYDVRVVIPLYSDISWDYRNKFKYIGNIFVPLAWRNQYCGVFQY